MKTAKYLYILLVIAIISCSGEDEPVPSTTNQSGDYTIAPIVIGDQNWSDKNLNVKSFRNGLSIRQAKDAEEWTFLGAQGKAAWAYPNFNSAFANRYGLIYNWYAVNGDAELAPEGWRIASDEDWDTLFTFVSESIETDFLNGDLEIQDYMTEISDDLVNPYFAGLRSAAVYALRSRELWSTAVFEANNSTEMIEVQAGPGIDLFNFTVLPAGFINSDGNYIDRNQQYNYQYTYFWTSTESPDAAAIFYQFDAINNYPRYPSMSGRLSKDIGMVVRCVKEN